MTPFGPWLPDQPDYRGEPSLIEALNCLPRADGSYGPLPQMDGISAALPARALALTSTRSVDGAYSMFAGSASHLYQFNAGGDWTQVSKTGGYTLNTEEFERPEFAQFGELLVAAMGIGNPLQVFNLDSGSQFSDLSGTAPRAKHVAVVRDHIMVGNTWDSVQGTRQDQIWWPAIGNPQSWPTIGSDDAATLQSDRQVLPDGGAIQKIVPGVGAHDAAILGETRIWTTDYVGSPVIFRIDPIEGAKGCLCSGSVVPYAAGIFYLAADGLNWFNGSESTGIGRGKVDEWLLADLDEAYRDNMTGAFDQERGLVLWSYAGAGNLSGLPNRILAYEPLTGRFTRGRLDVDLIAPAFTAGYTLEGLDSLGYTIETLPFSLDSRIWKGGSVFTAGIRSSDRKLAAFGSSPLQCDLTTNDMSGEMGSRFWLDGVRVYGDGSASISAAIGWRDSIQSTPTVTSYVTQDEDFIDHLIAARYARLQVRRPAGGTWTKLQGYDARMRPEGLR